MKIILFVIMIFYSKVHPFTLIDKRAVNIKDTTVPDEKKV